MKRVNLDFKRQGPRFSATGAIVLAAGLAVAAQLAWMERELSANIQSAEQKVARLEKEGGRRVQRPGQGRAADGAALQLEVRQANEILHQLALPWHGLFKAIESSNEKEVALLAVQPDMQRRVLRLSGEAKNFDALLAYVGRLEKDEALSQVYITQHEIRSQDPEKPVRFALVATWVADSVEKK
jgi:Tfp pilus assembly protein PilN